MNIQSKYFSHPINNLQNKQTFNGNALNIANIDIKDQSGDKIYKPVKSDFQTYKDRLFPAQYKSQFNDINFKSKSVSNSASYIRMEKALQYVQNRRAELENSGIKLNSFDYLDVSKLEGILYNLPTYKNIKTEDLPLFYNTVGLALSVGCHNECHHCFVKAPKFANTYNNAVTVVNWEGFSQFCEDTKKLNERLGFSVLGYLERLYSIYDADPISTRIKDKDNNFHYVADIAEKYYDCLGLGLIFSTAGWEQDDEIAQNAAKQLCNLTLKRPETVAQLRVSLHPFQKLMKQANDNYTEYLKNEDKESASAKKSYDEYIKLKDAYVNRMANVLKEFIPVMDTGLFCIEWQYSIFSDQYPYSKQQLIDLCTEILDKLEERCKKDGIDSTVITSEKDPFKNKLFNRIRKITSIGRDKNSSSVTFPSIFHMEKDNEKNNIVIEPFGAENFFANDVVKSITENYKKGNHIFDNVIVNVNPNNGTDAIMLKNSLIKSEYEALSNLEKNLDSTLSKLPDTGDVIIRFIYNKDNETETNFVELIKDRINDKHYSFRFEDKDAADYKNSYTAIQDFKEIVNGLSKENRINFVKYILKYIDINGRLGFAILNYPRFGYGSLKDRMFYLSDAKIADDRIKTGIR